MRNYRYLAFELVEEGMVDPELMVEACLKYMSQDAIGEMLKLNELMEVQDEY